MRLSARHGLALRISFFALMLLSVFAADIDPAQRTARLEHDIAAAVDHGHSHAGGAGDNLDRITPLALMRYCIRQTRVSLEACSRPTSTWLHYRWPVKSMLCDF
jgi:hypothetical protein